VAGDRGGAATEEEISELTRCWGEAPGKETSQKIIKERDREGLGGVGVYKKK